MTEIQRTHIACDHCVYEKAPAPRGATVHEAGCHLCAPCDQKLKAAQNKRDEALL